MGTPSDVERSAVGGEQKALMKGSAKLLTRKSWLVAVACLAVLLIGAFGYRWLGPSLFRGGNITIIGGVERHYKNASAMTQEIAILWPWEYMTVEEKYNAMIFEGKGYRTRASAISQELLGAELGTCMVSGYDIYTESTYIESFPVRQIRNVSPDELVAVEMEGAYYVYLQDVYDPPATLGQFMDELSLPQTVEWNRYSAMEGFHSTGYYEITEDDPIWQVLETCRDAKVVEDSDDWTWGLSERNYCSFTMTSEALGVYKKALYITDDGYLWTNVMEYAYLYDIGTEAAASILSYVKEQGMEVEMEPYEYRLAGTLVAVEDGYALVDDTILCKEAEDGIVYRVPLEDIRVRRCVEFAGMDVGDIVVVSFRGQIDVEGGYIIQGVTSMDEGHLSDGHVLVPE